MSSYELPEGQKEMAKRNGCPGAMTGATRRGGDKQGQGEDKDLPPADASIYDNAHQWHLQEVTRHQRRCERAGMGGDLVPSSTCSILIDVDEKAANNERWR